MNQEQFESQIKTMVEEHKERVRADLLASIGSIINGPSAKQPAKPAARRAVSAKPRTAPQSKRAKQQPTQKQTRQERLRAVVDFVTSNQMCRARDIISSTKFGADDVTSLLASAVESGQIVRHGEPRRYQYAAATAN